MLFHKAIHLFILSLARSHCLACRLWVTVSPRNGSETSALSGAGCSRSSPGNAPPALPVSRLRFAPGFAAPTTAQRRSQSCFEPLKGARSGFQAGWASYKAGRKRGERNSALAAKSRSAAASASGSGRPQERPAAPAPPLPSHCSCGGNECRGEEAPGLGTT